MPVSKAKTVSVGRDLEKSEYQSIMTVDSVALIENSIKLPWRLIDPHTGYVLKGSEMKLSSQEVTHTPVFIPALFNRHWWIQVGEQLVMHAHTYTYLSHIIMENIQSWKRKFCHHQGGLAWRPCTRWKILNTDKCYIVLLRHGIIKADQKQKEKSSDLQWEVMCACLKFVKKVGL